MIGGTELLVLGMLILATLCVGATIILSGFAPSDSMAASLTLIAFVGLQGRKMRVSQLCGSDGSQGGERD